jgi:phosphatidylglycerophosphate synthase
MIWPPHETWIGAHWGEKLELALPSVLTLIGLGFGVAYALGASLIFAALSIACDIADGQVARALVAETEIGARLDYFSDVAVLVLCVSQLPRPAPWSLLILVPIWAVAMKQHFSGRTLAMVVVALFRWRGWA